MEWSRYGDFEERKTGCPEVVIANEVDTGRDENPCDERRWSRVVFPLVA